MHVGSASQVRRPSLPGDVELHLRPLAADLAVEAREGPSHCVRISGNTRAAGWVAPMAAFRAGASTAAGSLVGGAVASALRTLNAGSAQAESVTAPVLVHVAVGTGVAAAGMFAGARAMDLAGRRCGLTGRWLVAAQFLGTVVTGGLPFAGAHVAASAANRSADGLTDYGQRFTESLANSAGRMTSQTGRDFMQGVVFNGAKDRNAGAHSIPTMLVYDTDGSAIPASELMNGYDFCRTLIAQGFYGVTSWLHLAEGRDYFTETLGFEPGPTFQERMLRTLGPGISSSINEAVDEVFISVAAVLMATLMGLELRSRPGEGCAAVATNIRNWRATLGLWLDNAAMRVTLYTLVEFLLRVADTKEGDEKRNLIIAAAVVMSFTEWRGHNVAHGRRIEAAEAQAAREAVTPPSAEELALRRRVEAMLSVEMSV